MRDERDELLEEIERELRRHVGPFDVRTFSYAKEGVAANLVRMFERARMNGVIKYPRP